MKEGMDIFKVFVDHDMNLHFMFYSEFLDTILEDKKEDKK